MLLAQSRKQHLFNLVMHYCVLMLALAVFVLITFPLSEFFAEMRFTMLKWLGFFSIIFLWLAAFNSGKSKLTEKGVSLDEDGIGYIYFGREKKIRWSEIARWSVKRGAFGSFSIYSKTGKQICFSYYAFSSWQRAKIKQALISRCPSEQKISGN